MLNRFDTFLGGNLNITIAKDEYYSEWDLEHLQMSAMWLLFCQDLESMDSGGMDTK